MAGLLAQKIIALFVIILAGYLLVKLKVLNPKDAQVISKILLYLIVPCSCMNAFIIERTPEILKGLLAAVSAAVLIHAVMLPFTALIKKPLGITPVEQDSILYSNCGNLIIPLVSSLLGSEWVIYTTAYLVVNQLFLFTHGKSVMLGKPCYDFKSVLTTPTITGILIGAVFFATGFRLPGPVQSGIANIGGMVGGLSMLVAGMRIGGMKLTGILKYKRIFIPVLFRLILIPLLAIPVMKIAALVSGADSIKNALMIVFLAASAPSATSVVNLAVLYDREADYASMINAASTLSCVVTMPLMIMVYQLVL